jgi:hypothetical protein
MVSHLLEAIRFVKQNLSPANKVICRKEDSEVLRLVTTYVTSWENAFICQMYILTCQPDFPVYVPDVSCKEVFIQCTSADVELDSPH